MFYLIKKWQGERQSYSNRVEVVLGKWQVTVQSLCLYESLYGVVMKVSGSGDEG